MCFLALLTILRFSPGPSTKYKIVRRIKRSFTPFLTIRDAELLVAHDNAVTSDAELKRRRKGAIFRLSAPISVLSLCEVLAWSSLASYAFMTQHTSAWMNLALAISWLFTALRLLIKPSMTPPYDILCLLVIQLCTATVCLAAIWYNLYASGKGWPGGWELSARLLDVSIISALLAIILRTPVELPGKDVDTSRIVSLSTNYISFTANAFVGSRYIPRGLCYPLGMDDFRLCRSPHQEGQFVSADYTESTVRISNYF